ncbi:unnamed protein product, partial [Amoebophrya sp. A25]|eukprot:GSA25T00001835001.1
MLDVANEEANQKNCHSEMNSAEDTLHATLLEVLHDKRDFTGKYIASVVETANPFLIRTMLEKIKKKNWTTSDFPEASTLVPRMLEVGGDEVRQSLLDLARTSTETTLVGVLGIGEENPTFVLHFLKEFLWPHDIFTSCSFVIEILKFLH